MATVTGPCFSSWASGSLAKTLTYKWFGKGTRFFVYKYKERAGKRHPIQIQNSQIFKDRQKAIKELQNIGNL